MSSFGQDRSFAHEGFDLLLTNRSSHPFVLVVGNSNNIIMDMGIL